MESWEKEIAAAEKAREEGNEGRARVCARRAAGIKAREYLDRHSVHPGASAIDALKKLAELGGITADLHQAASNLVLRVDNSFDLPVGIDLIADARLICKKL